ncbi:MAG: rod shape-determining protein RodA [Pseudomonadota bacterium]
MLQFKNKKFDQMDMGTFFIMLSLIGLGLLNLYSATFISGKGSVSSIFISQTMWVLLGFLAMVLAIVIDYKYLDKLAWVLYGLICLALIYVLVAERSIAGSKRWIDLGFFRFQPSEVTKLVMIIVLAKYFSSISKASDYVLKDLLVPLLIIAFPSLLILKEPDLGTCIVIILVSFSIIFHIGLNYKSLLKIIISTLVAIPIMWFFVLKEYQKDRIRVFLDPAKDPLGDAWHITQSIIAVGSGMLFGKGFMSGTQNRLEFVPKQHTDFIFSVCAEEWGFLGCFIVLALFFFLIARGIAISSKLKDRFAAILTAGVVFMLFWHTFINIGMELDILPVVGIPLPFMSYGGSAMVMNMICIGLIINVQLRKHQFA